MKILVMNAGSSTQKSALYELGDRLPTTPPAPLWTGQLDWGQQAGQVQLQVETATNTQQTTFASTSRLADTRQLLDTLWSGPHAVLTAPTEIDCVGHRVVHGGTDYRQSTVITPAVKGAIAALASLAPAHNPVNLEGIEISEQVFGPQVPQVAVFDTAFHSQMPPAAATYPVPYAWFEQGMRRYGFHGISHQFCAQRAAQLLQRALSDLRLIICHLGNGCSLSAVRDGHSVDTTMGFTPLEGLMMGTRSGSVDPGLVLHQLRQGNYTVDELDRVLNKESGLLGVSGRSGDMRQIQAAIAQGHDRAQLAFDLYIHRLRAGIGAMLGNLGGLDALVFTAGVGENAAAVRAAVCEGFQFLGLELDADQNAARPVDVDIATPNSTVRVLVLHTQEDWAIAQECWQLLQAAAPV